MADLFQVLTEARIREWESRPKSEQRAKAEGFQSAASHEKQLLDEIIRLIELARELPADRADENLSAAARIEVQLMASLESQGLHLTARRIAGEIEELKSR